MSEQRKSRQQARADRLREEGLVRYPVWIPDGQQEYFRMLADVAVRRYREEKSREGA